MKYQSSNTKLVHDLEFQKPGRYKCPECGDSSKRTNPKDLEFYEKEQSAYCHKCNTTLYPYKPYDKGREYSMPVRKNITQLSDKALKYWEGRMISQETLNKLGVYSDKEYMPQSGKEQEVICFPFYRADELVNIKYRGPNKTFKLHKDAELIWYNFDALISHDEIIICEGEGEVLTWVENGYINVISVPNGANAKNMDYLDGSIKLFDEIKAVYLATDNDSKGVELRDELARRIGVEKCSIISFKEKKDGNEYFCKYGGIEFKKLLKESKPVPVKGIVKVDQIQMDIIDLYENGIAPGKGIDFEEIDKYCTWELGRLAIVTGIPGCGKSEFLDFLISKLNLIHGWKAAYFTPENTPLSLHYSKLHRKYSGKTFAKQYDNETFWGIYEHIKNNFYYIMNEEDMTVREVLNNAKLLVKKYGVKVVVIDPYNRLDHYQEKHQTETQYISKFLDEVTMFAKLYNVLVFLVAHPSKLQQGETPTLYSISGSAHFFNKADYGFTVDRVRDDNKIMTNDVNIYWQKIKFQHLGEQGISELRWNYTNGRYEERVSVDQWDNSNWLYNKCS